MRPGRHRRVEVRILAENRGLELLQRRTRVDAELVSQPPAHLPTDRERLGLPPGPVQRQHQLPAQVLPVRVLPDQLRQLRYQLGVFAQGQSRLGQRPGRVQVDGGQPLGFGVQPGQPGHISQRPTTPQFQRRPQPRRPQVRAGLPPALLDQARRDLHVGRLRTTVEQVPGTAGDDRVPVAEHPSQIRHVTLHRVQADSGRPSIPHHIDEPVGTDDFTRRQPQHGQHCLAPQPVDRPSLAPHHHIHWPEQPYQHSASLTAGRSRLRGSVAGRTAPGAAHRPPFEVPWCSAARPRRYGR